MRVFVDVRGLSENLGDSVLRRAWLDALRPIGQINALVGDDADYASGLGLTAQDRPFRQWGPWFRSALRAGAGRRTVFALNAGELSVHRQFAARLTWQAALASTVRMRGGTVLLAGVGFRGGSTGLARSMRPVTALAGVVSWRDEWTRSLLGIGEVNPDWAFALGQSSDNLDADDRNSASTSRRQIAVSMRGDRPEPSAAWVTAVRRLADDNGCALVVVTQVRGDHQRSEMLAALLDARHLRWENDKSHHEHEALVRDAYARSRAVVSDRIHALIIGLTEGAVPIGFTTGKAEKVSRTFAAVTDTKVGFGQDELTGPDLRAHLQHLLDARRPLLNDLHAARERLAQLTSRIQASSTAIPDPTQKREVPPSQNLQRTP
jgi:hypothetical protein